MSKTIIKKLLRGDLPTDFNWNYDEHPDVPLPKEVPIDPTVKQISKMQIVSEDLRDGLHGVSEYPSPERMMTYVSTLFSLGIRAMTVGIYPGEKNKMDQSIKTLLKYMRQTHPKITPIVLSLASEESLQWAYECKRINPKLNALVFIGSSPSRLLVEEWNKKYILRKLAWAVKTATHKYHMDVIGATEHTTQTPPDFLRDIVTTVVQNGAKYFCIADTIGIARPIGTVRIVHFVKTVLQSLGADRVLIDWHGHDDLGNSDANALCAIAAGANRVHTVARGIGERAGNTKMESVLINCTEILSEANKKIPWNLGRLNDALSQYNELTGSPPPTHGPLGIRAFRTSLGIHTAAMLKAQHLAQEAERMKRKTLARRLGIMARKIYSAIDATTVGRHHEIRVGPWSGISTVQLAALLIGIDTKTLSPDTIEQVLSTAKKFGRELTVEELKQLLLTNHNGSS